MNPRLVLLLLIGLTCMLRLPAQNVTVTGAAVGNGSYPTLGAAFAAINGGAQTGATIIVNIVANTNEGAASAVLNAGTWTSLTVRPQGGAARTILGATTPGQGLIHLNGADQVSILGLNSGGNALTIENTTVSPLGGTSTIHFSNDASQNTVDRCSVKGSSTNAGTNAATVLIGTAGPVTGNDNNTLSSCNIGPSGSNLHGIAVFSEASYPNSIPAARFSSGNTVTQCNIFDYFNPAFGSFGIYLSYGSEAWSISNNRFYQTGVRTQTAPRFHGAIAVSGVYYPTGGNKGHFINGNSIGGASASGVGTYSIVGAGNGTSVFGIGIFSAEPAFNSPMIFNNTISNISISGPVSGTGFYSVFSGIRAHDGVPRIGFAGGNVIGSPTNPNSITVNSTSNLPMDVFAIYCNVSTSCVHHQNQIGGIAASNTNTGRVYLAGIYSLLGYTDISYNQIGFASAPLQLNSNNPASALVGITVQTNVLQCFENTIRSLSSNSPNPGTGASAGLIGMRVNSTWTQPLISRNDIFELSNSNPTAPVSVTGLVMIGIPGTPEGEIDQNDIHSLDVASSHAGSKITGLHLVNGDHKVSNNFIRLGHRANGTSITRGLQIEGIRESAGSNSLFHNSVYVGGSSVADTATTYAFVSAVAQGSRRYHNNIFDNARSNSALGAGKHFAIGLQGANLQLAGLESDHNVFFAPGVGGRMGRLGAVELGSVSDWQFHTGKELNSILWNPGFIQPAGSATTGNLRIGTGPTPIEGRGDAARSRYEDFDFGVRSSLTPVDIGADAGLFIPANTGPEIIVRGAGMTIFDGDSLPRLSDGTDFDSVSACIGTAVRSFSIQNTGTDTLMLNGITFGGVHASDFSVLQLPPPFLIPGGSGNLQVSFSPSGTGIRKVWLYIANDDLDESSYGFLIQGKGRPDTMRPQAICQPALLYLDSTGQATLTAAQVDGGSTDNCGVDSLAVNSSTFTCNATGQQPVVLSVWDASGNQDSCLALVNVVDSSAPVVLCQPVLLPLDSSGQATLAASQLDAGSTDNCGVDSLAISRQQFDCSHAGANLVTLRGWDTSGNLDSCMATVTVTEVTPPQAVCQSIQVALDNNGQATILPTQLDAGSTDNCGLDSMAVSQTLFDCSYLGSNAVVFYVWDLVGNVDSCLAAVTIADTSAPQAICQPTLLYLDHAGQAALNAAQVDGGSTDNCGVDSLVANPVTFTCNETGQQPVVLSVWDANGNLDSCLALVHVVDSSAPAILCQSLSLPLDSSGQATLAASQLDAGSTDNCGVDSLAISRQQFDCSHAGANLVTLRGWDTSGNLDSCMATVTVTEVTPPQAVCQSIQVALDNNGQATILPTQLDAGSTDNCGIDSMAVSQTLFDCSNVGSNLVVLSVWDVSGNWDTCQAFVHIPLAPLSLVLVADTFACGHPIRCAGEASGSIEALVSGGCPPLSYQWSNGALTANLDSLTAGSYAVTVTDGSGQSRQASLLLTNPAPLVLSTQLLDIPCGATAGGAAKVLFQGGNACNGYALVWSNGATQASISNLERGLYTVTVTDIMGCQGIDSVWVPSLPLPSPFIRQHLDTLRCTAPFPSYQWYLNGQAIPYMRDPFLVPDTSGTYHVEVRDSSGCVGMSNVLWMTSIRHIQQGHHLDNLLLAPNPAQGYVTLVAGDPVRTGVRLGFYDAAGRLIRRMERPELEDEWVIDIHDLSAGIYFLNVSANNGAYKVLRLVVQD